MKEILLSFLFLLASAFAKGQLVPELYNEKLTHKKALTPWTEKTTTIIEIDNNKEQKYITSKIEEDKNSQKTHTFFNSNGTIDEINKSYFENENLRIYQTKDGNKEETRYDDNGNITSIKWFYPNGSIDETTYTYDGLNLTKIVEKDEFDTYIEILNYKDDKLKEIVSIDEEETIIMTRIFSYNENGTINKLERIEDNQINKTILYNYNNSDQLVSKEESKINRFTGTEMPPDTYEYSYHNNGVLKEEKWTTYADMNATTIKVLYITEYNELGLETKEIIKDYSDNSEQIYLYEYKIKK